MHSISFTSGFLGFVVFYVVGFTNNFSDHELYHHITLDWHTLLLL
jgi:hypothetical protein